MAQHVVEAAGPPTEAPPSQGAHYIDLTTGDIYLAFDITSAADWKLVGEGSGLVTGYELWTFFVSTDNITQYYGITRDGGDGWFSDLDQLRDGWKVLSGGELDSPVFTRGAQRNIGQAVCINGSDFTS